MIRLNRVHVQILLSLLTCIWFSLLSPLLGPSSPVVEATTTSLSANIKTGDHIQFGTYHGQPIVWTVIRVQTGEKWLLFANHVLTLKSFDAAGGVHVDVDRKKLGANY